MLANNLNNLDDNLDDNLDNDDDTFDDIYDENDGSENDGSNNELSVTGVYSIVDSIQNKRSSREEYAATTLTLQRIRIENYANFSFIELGMPDNNRPFTIVSKQDDVPVCEIGNMFLYMSTGFAEKLRPLIETDSGGQVCSLELDYDSVDLSQGSITGDKIKYRVSLSRDGIEEEQILANDVSTYYTCNTHSKPVYMEALSKFIYMSLEAELVDVSENISTLLSQDVSTRSELIAKINHTLIGQMGYMERPMSWSITDNELLYYDEEMESYMSIVEAPVNIQAVIYIIICSYNAAKNNQILVIDDFRGINISAKIICIAMFISFSVNRNSHLILIDDEDYQGYIENVLTNKHVYKTSRLSDGSYCITNGLLVP